VSGKFHPGPAKALFRGALSKANHYLEALIGFYRKGCGDASQAFLFGFVQSLETTGNLTVADKPVLMRRAGGAARITICNQTAPKTGALTRDINRLGLCPI